jgi:hypothetical protein
MATRDLYKELEDFTTSFVGDLRFAIFGSRDLWAVASANGIEDGTILRQIRG